MTATEIASLTMSAMAIPPTIFDVFEHRRQSNWRRKKLQSDVQDALCRLERNIVLLDWLEIKLTITIKNAEDPGGVKAIADDAAEILSSNQAECLRILNKYLAEEGSRGVLADIEAGRFSEGNWRRFMGDLFATPPMMKDEDAKLFLQASKRCFAASETLEGVWRLSPQRKTVTDLSGTLEATLSTIETAARYARELLKEERRAKDK